MKQYSRTWNLNNLFENGSRSLQLTQAIQKLSEGIKELKISLEKTSLQSSIIQLQNLEMLQQEIQSFIHCLMAQDVSDKEAIQLEHQIASIKSELETLSCQLNTHLISLSESEFEILLSDPLIQPIAFVIQERREWAKEKLPLPQEQIINRLSVDGYQGWQVLYEKLMGQTRIPFNQDELSVGQAESRLSHPERSVRKTIFHQWKKTWQQQEETYAHILNHLGGFRLQTYAERGWSSILKEPLFYNRMTAETLHMMWEVIENNKHVLLTYLAQKAQFLQLPQLSWIDIDAPLSTHNTALIPFDEASEIIVDQFTRFSPRMGRFAEDALKNKWLETEDRAGKLPGGFCSGHPQSKQSRIFMTYSGTTLDVFTLAHELGHAYHNEAVKNLPYMAQEYRMNVAETASTLGEMIMVDSMIKQANDPEKKRILLDNKLQRSVLFLMNIHARYLFETRFYAQREKGVVSVSELNHLMESAQKEAFHNALSEWYPHFWVSKRHFYMTDVPFYNFPYTFGYLFSLGIYAFSLNQEKGFEKSYDALLSDTGRMNVEALAKKHLGADLTKPDFWQNALDLIRADVENYTTMKTKELA